MRWHKMDMGASTLGGWVEDATGLLLQPERRLAEFDTHSIHALQGSGMEGVASAVGSEPVGLPNKLILLA